MDVWIVFGVDSGYLWMYSFVAGAGQACKSLVDLDERIANVEVGVIVVAGEPARGRVGNLVGLWREALTLYESAEGLCVSKVFCS